MHYELLANFNKLSFDLRQIFCFVIDNKFVYILNYQIAKVIILQITEPPKTSIDLLLQVTEPPKTSIDLLLQVTELQ